jgi:hypothetical protein
MIVQIYSMTSIADESRPPRRALTLSAW